MLNSVTIESLKAAGWSESYGCDISMYRSLFQEYGCPLPQVVEEFLRNYGGIHIRHRMPLTQAQRDFLDRRKRQDDDKLVTPEYIEFEFDFDINVEWNIRFLRRRGASNCSDYESLAKRAGVKGLWPIGTYDNLSYTLVMSEIGSVFACADQVLLFVADSGELAIQTLLQTEDLPEIP